MVVIQVECGKWKAVKKTLLDVSVEDEKWAVCE